MNTTPQKIVIVGAGYAGVMAANNLAGEHAVTVVNPRPFFVERVRLNQYVADTHPAQVPLTSVLHSRAHLIVASVVAIRPAERQVRLDNGQVFTYDYLVYAAGSHAAPATIAGADLAYDNATWESAQRLRARLEEKPTSVTLVGGGLTAVETAAEIAEVHRETKVRLVAGGLVLPNLSPRGRRAVLRKLARLGVQVIENRRVHEVTPDAIVLDGQLLESEVTVLATGMRAAPLAEASGLTTDADGQLVTDAALRSVDSDRIIAAGDAAATTLRMSCAAAFITGPTAARTVRSVIDSSEPRALNGGFAGINVRLGRKRAVVQLVKADDSPRSIVFTGATARTIKEQICRFTIRWLAKEASKPGSYKWPGGPALAIGAPETGAVGLRTVGPGESVPAR